MIGDEEEVIAIHDDSRIDWTLDQLVGATLVVEDLFPLRTTVLHVGSLLEDPTGLGFLLNKETDTVHVRIGLQVDYASVIGAVLYGYATALAYDRRSRNFIVFGDTHENAITDLTNALRREQMHDTAKVLRDVSDSVRDRHIAHEMLKWNAIFGSSESAGTA